MLVRPADKFKTVPDTSEAGREKHLRVYTLCYSSLGEVLALPLVDLQFITCERDNLCLKTERSVSNKNSVIFYYTNYTDTSQKIKTIPGEKIGRI